MIIIITIFFLITPIISIPLLLLGIIGDSKKRKIYCVFLAISIGIIAYNFQSQNYNLDINRYYDIMSEYKNIKFNMFYKNILLSKSEPLKNLLFYIFSNNPRIWLFCVSTICYIIIFYIICDMARRKKINKGSFVIFFILMIISYNNYLTLTGIRNQLALTIYLLALYLEFFKKVKKNLGLLSLYILPCLIHQSMILGIILRIFVEIYNKKTKKFFVIMPPIIWMFLDKLNHILIVLENIPILKNIFYQKETYSSINTDVLSNINSLIYVAILINSLLIFKVIYEKKDIQEKESSLMNVFWIFIISILPYWVVLFRWFKIVLMLFIIYIYNGEQTINSNTKRYIIINFIVIFLILLILDVRSFIDMKYFSNIFSISLMNITNIFK